MKETILITGGAGNLAAQLSFELDGMADEIVLVDIANGPITRTAENCVYIQENLNNRNEFTTLR